jgi:hypothetical protein
MLVVAVEEENFCRTPSWFQRAAMLSLKNGPQRKAKRPAAVIHGRNMMVAALSEAQVLKRMSVPSFKEWQRPMLTT